MDTKWTNCYLPHKHTHSRIKFDGNFDYNQTVEFNIFNHRAGFMVFYDFVVGLSPATQLLRLVVGLYNLANPYCDPTVFPAVSCQFNVQDGLKSAVIGARQPAPGYEKPHLIGWIVCKAISHWLKSCKEIIDWLHSL